jgi:predicted phage terminase large subunit-like protein
MKMVTVKKRGWFSKKPEKECFSTLEDLKNIALDEDDLVRSITKKSFYDHVVEFWDTAVPDKYASNWHIKYICDAVQEEMELAIAGHPKRYDYVVINVPPGSSKSTILMVMLNSWLWSRMPSAGFIGCSYRANLAIKKARLARQVITSEKYQRCFPEVRIARDMNAMGSFGTTKNGERHSAGTQGMITGFHGTVIVLDDPLDPRGARSAAMKMAVREFVFETLPSRVRRLDLVPTFVIQQRLAEDDTTGLILDLAKTSSHVKIKHICLPATVSDLVNPPELKRFYKDGLLDPLRLSRENLAKQRDIVMEYGYAGQYDQSPIPAGGAMFDVTKFKYDEKPPDINNPKLWVKQVRYWDKAATYDDGCYTVGVRMGKTPDQKYWVLHVDRFRFESRARENRIRRVAEIDGPNVIVGIEQEGGSGGKESAQATVRNLAGFRVVTDRPTGDKITRADPFATQVNGENVYLVPEGLIEKLPEAWHTPYVNEHQFFPFGKFKDQVDASSGAFHLLTSGVFQVGFYKGKGK